MTIARRYNDDRITRKMVAAWRALRDDPSDAEGRELVLSELAARPWEFPADFIFAEDDAGPDWIQAQWWWTTRELRRRLNERACELMNDD